MGSLVVPRPLRRRARLAGALLLIPFLVLAAPRRGEGREVDARRASPSCTTLARVPGPEDLVVEEGRDRLLVSSQDRRPDPWPPGAIWAVPLDPDRKPHRLDLAARGYKCSFHPHGIDLVESCEGRLLLYVLNHHDPEDRLPERGCFATGMDPGVAPRGRISSVEVFEVEERRLRFLQRLMDPEVLTNGNDLVALPNGDLWLTDPPAGAWVRAKELLGWDHASRVVQFRCTTRRDGLCLGDWAVRTDPQARGERIRYANGIAYRSDPGGASGCDGESSGVLYVAGGAGRRLHRYRVEGDRPLTALDEIPFARRARQPNPDNLTWADEDRTTLLAAGHPDLRRFLQHSQTGRALSPSAVVAVGVEPGPSERPTPLFHDAGGLVSGASVAVCAGGDLVLGQVFEPAVIRCVLPAPCGEEAP